MRSAMLRFPFNLVTSCLCSKPPFILRSLDRRLISLILSAQRSSSSSSDLALARAKNASMTRPFCVKRRRRCDESRAPYIACNAGSSNRYIRVKRVISGLPIPSQRWVYPDRKELLIKYLQFYISLFKSQY